MEEIWVNRKCFPSSCGRRFVLSSTKYESISSLKFVNSSNARALYRGPPSPPSFHPLSFKICNGCLGVYIHLSKIQIVYFFLNVLEIHQIDNAVNGRRPLFVILPFRKFRWLGCFVTTRRWPLTQLTSWPLRATGLMLAEATADHARVSIL